MFAQLQAQAGRVKRRKQWGQRGTGREFRGTSREGREAQALNKQPSFVMPSALERQPGAA